MTSVVPAGGCASCHATPNEDADKVDRTKLGGGLPLKSPFGTFYVPNISSDPADGIGGWSEADFVTAMWKGTSTRRGRHLYPAFPYTSYSHMTLGDVRDLMAYLRSLPPVQGRAPAHRLSFPFNIRRGLGLWKLVYLHAGTPAADPTQSAEWNRGRYLVEGPGHCAECHSPRDFLGGIIASRRLTGGPLPEGKGKAPNITAEGLKDWSEDDIETALSTGFTPSGDVLGGPMALEVGSLSKAPAADLAAIAHYLKNYRPGSNP